MEMSIGAPNNVILSEGQAATTAAHRSIAFEAVSYLLQPELLQSSPSRRRG
jgi:hypothetical protein